MFKRRCVYFCVFVVVVLLSFASFNGAVQRNKCDNISNEKSNNIVVWNLMPENEMLEEFGVFYRCFSMKKYQISYFSDNS